MEQGRFLFQDDIDAHNYWKDKEFKKWAVEVRAGPAKKPTFARTYYAHARTAERAIAAAMAQALDRSPRNAEWRARLAGPRELGCTSPKTLPSPAALAQS